MSKEYLIAVNMSDYHTETTANDCHILDEGVSSLLTVWQFNDCLSFSHKSQWSMQSDCLNTLCFDIWSHNAFYTSNKESADYSLIDRCLKTSHL